MAFFRFFRSAFVFGCASLVAGIVAAAGAQEVSGSVDASAIPRVVASQTPVVGEVVISEAGDVAPYFKKVETCNVRGCRVFIYDNRTGALINNDGAWAPAYARTGIGQEVIRVKSYSEAELPESKPSSDELLKSAPRVRIRESSDRQQN